MSTVYRNFTAEQLQAQYSARDAVPEHPEIFQCWQHESAAYRAEANAVLDLSYGESAREKLDLFLPSLDSKTEKAPLFIFIHGGYWQAMDKNNFSFIARELTRHGTAVAILNYDLCPSVTLDEITAQIRHAVIWLWQHAGEYRIDNQQLHLCGHSAGGHLTAAIMATDWNTVQADFDSRVIRSGLSISGVFELEPLIHTSINNALGLDPQSAQRNSPLLMKPRLKIPLVLTVGGNETDEFHRQSQDFARAWAAQGVPTHYLLLAGLNHFTIIDQLAIPDSPLLERALGLMRD